MSVAAISELEHHLSTLSSVPERCEYLNRLARALQDSNPERGFSVAEEAKELAEKHAYLEGVRESFLSLALLSSRTDQYEKALSYANQALEHYEDTRSVPAMLPNILGNAYRGLGDYAQALEHYLDALKRCDESGEDRLKAGVLTNIGTIYTLLGDYDRESETHREALEQFRLLGDERGEAIALNNLAMCSKSLGKLEEAIALGQEGLRLCREKGLNTIEIHQLVTLGEVYQDVGPEVAMGYFSEAKGKSHDLGLQVTQMTSAMLLGKTLVQHDLERARLELLEALSLAQEMKAALELSEIHEALSAVYQQKGDPEKALYHFQAFHRQDKELFNDRADQRYRTLQVLHDTERAKQNAELYRLRTEELEGRVEERTRALEAAQLEVLERLAITGERRDDDTGQHTLRVGTMSALLAEKLGLPTQEVETLRIAARLHDIGKVGIPDSILLKPGKLTEEEFDTMKRHTTIGAEMLAGGSSDYMTMAEIIALTHHERWDGLGYPKGLQGEVIPLVGRIVSLTDKFDAFLHDRPYKKAWSREEAIRTIKESSGTLLDPAVVAAFESLLEENSI